jgi:hypothetical protein
MLWSRTHEARGSGTSKAVLSPCATRRHSEEARDVAFMVEALEEAAKQSKWVYLTEEEMLDIVDTYGMQLADAIEAKVKEKNA